MSALNTVQRYSSLIKLISIGLIVLALLVLASVAPMGPLVESLRGWIDDLGVWGPVALGVIYVIATVLLLPGFLLTVAAGAIFGLVTGTIVVSLAATTGVALTFLISRYLARDRVAAWVKRYPKFHAIDRALGAGGWKVVALLRLSPIVPFNLQNYAYGLTPIGFWTCVLTSWLFMLPGTFMYVYLGKAAGLAAFTAAGGGAGRARTPGEWALLGLGLAATIAVTIYLTYLARTMLQRQTDIAHEAGAQPRAARAHDGQGGAPWSAIAMVVIAVLLVGAAAYARVNAAEVREALGALLGPPSTNLSEVYPEKPDAAAFDHSAFDGVLRAHVDKDGFVDYAALASDAKPLDDYIAALAGAGFDDLGRDEKLGLLINAYNAFTLRLILDYWKEGKLASIMDIPANQRWKDARWNIGGKRFSLEQIEHEEIRPKFREPRIHFALVCAAYSCPPLRNEAYVGAKLEAQLQAQAEYVHSHDRWFRFDAASNIVRLTKLYDWYGGDFAQVAGSALEYAARYVPALKRALEAGSKPKIEWIEYDWKLNSRANAPGAQ